MLLIYKLHVNNSNIQVIEHIVIGTITNSLIGSRRKMINITNSENVTSKRMVQRCVEVSFYDECLL